MQDVEIPYGAYWSSPFARWQGALANHHSLILAAEVAKRELMKRRIDAAAIEFGVLGMTVPQRGSFYGLPWLMGMIGAEGVAGPTISQACATGARVLAVGNDEIAAQRSQCALVIAADRVSNGPHIVYPRPDAAGGAGEYENWILDNFGADPFAGCAMIQTAENVANRFGISKEEQHELVLMRYAQYQDALKDDRAFQKRYMTLPFEVPGRSRKKAPVILDGDEGIYPTSAEKMAALSPVIEGGTVTFAAQTHPADGNAAILLTTPEKAIELSSDAGIRISIIAFGQSREEKGFMPSAPIGATRAALEASGLDIGDISVIKSHNPFAVNDLAFAKAFGIDVGSMNNYGCSLVWGHPQAPTGIRSIVEMIEELVIKGGGYGLFQGCAAGDSAMAVILKVEDRSQ
ncbi:acetyl-CoA acetyltransferase [Hoeflea sp. IMCC20628]|uniref:thiolase family protein n=1 Tax=Hoeflea sp. IMCC20628 TaxID=1620421 RepID=UPI00063AAB06|nr:thiolase family protein [Hoeflea sp. IMCC20628]AKI00732.1 acetyl-CoA acetyltransferase [Hoeflea sp. IMCC20628]